jgi:hypothetical protein
MTSLALKAIISAHETVRGHSFSSVALITSMNSYPLKEFAFGNASFSGENPSTESKSIDASQPCNPKV